MVTIAVLIGRVVNRMLTGGSGNGIANMVNSSVQRGLAPLQILTGGGK